jgi:pSer/pThr/pTyr-binding forkhead associated (FHA) protein
MAMVVQMHEGVAINKFQLDKPVLRIGRDPDLKSTNSTFVNGEKITRHKLRHNDLIRVGWNTFKFIDEAEGEPNKTAKIRKSWIPGVYYTEDES